MNSLYSLLQERAPIIITLIVIAGLSLVVVWALVLSNIELGAEEDNCSASSLPDAPLLLDVSQDPETLTVTAQLRDQSDNEQWFALARTLITRFNQIVVVGTDIRVPDVDQLPVHRDTGRTVTIDDRGIVENQKPRPGLEYVYTVRAWNCFGPSEASNDITILSLFPPEAD